MNRLEWIVLLVSATYIAVNLVSWAREANATAEMCARDAPSGSKRQKRCTVEELD
jgi:hypothetical protein